MWSLDLELELICCLLQKQNIRTSYHVDRTQELSSSGKIKGWWFKSSIGWRYISCFNGNKHILQYNAHLVSHNNTFSLFFSPFRLRPEFSLEPWVRWSSQLSAPRCRLWVCETAAEGNHSGRGPAAQTWRSTWFPGCKPSHQSRREPDLVKDENALVSDAVKSRTFCFELQLTNCLGAGAVAIAVSVISSDSLCSCLDHLELYKR